MVESHSSSQDAELANLRETSEERNRQTLDVSLREKILARRLAAKEQEIQEYLSQIAELKAAQAPGPAQLRAAMLDPAVNLLLQKLRQELLSTKARLEETQNELNAWKFTPDSNTGKRLMAKCRLLYQENEELGRMISSGRLAKLEGELALQKSFSEEVKKSQSEMDAFLQELDEDVEGMQSTIYYLQQELKKSKDLVKVLQEENTLLKSGKMPIDTKTNGEVTNDKTLGEHVKKNSDDTNTNETRTTNGLMSEEVSINSIKSESVDAETLKTWQNDQDESSNDSGGLILNIKDEEISEEESDKNLNDNLHSKVKVSSADDDTRTSSKESSRKRTSPSIDTSSNDSDNVPLIKKVRRNSDLNYHEGDIDSENVKKDHKTDEK